MFKIEQIIRKNNKIKTQMQNFALKTKEYFNNKYLCKDKKYYIRNGYRDNELEEVSGFPNPHQPGENNRRRSIFLQEKYLGYNKELQCYINDLVDVGGSKRYEVTNLARISLIPEVDINDYARHFPMVNPMNIKIKIKFEEFVQNYNLWIKKVKPIFIFYDVLYYIDLKVSHFVNDGLVAFGAMHIYKQDGPLYFDTEFGYIKKTEKGLIMYTDGNSTPYHHPDKYSDVLTKGFTILDINDQYNLILIKEHAFDCISTQYVSFHIIKTKIKPEQINVETSLSSDFIPEYKIGNGDLEEVQIILNKKMVRCKISVHILERARAIFASKSETYSGMPDKDLKQALKIHLWKASLGITNKDLKIVIEVIVQQFRDMEDEEF